MKIAISGSAGIGKSTLAQNLARILNAAYIPEYYEPLFSKPGQFGVPSAMLVEAFNQVLDIKLAEQAKHQDFVADRCPADLLNLWMFCMGPNLTEATELFYARCRKAMNSYDLIVLPPWGVLSLQATQDPLKVQQRRVNPWVQLHNHAAIDGLVRMFVQDGKILYLPRQPQCADTWLHLVLERLKSTGHTVG